MSAKDLYRSPLFRKRRAYAEASGKPWAILSALHGLIEPSQEIAPYDVRLSDLPRRDQIEWGFRTAAQLADRFRPVDGKTFEIHAGAAYVRPLEPALERLGARVARPLEGLSIGRQLQWYGTR